MSNRENNKLKDAAYSAQVTPPGEVWDGIVKQLPEKNRPVWIWWLTGVSILSLIGILSYVWLNQTDKGTELSHPIEQEISSGTAISDASKVTEKSTVPPTASTSEKASLKKAPLTDNPISSTNTLTETKSNSPQHPIATDGLSSKSSKENQPTSDNKGLAPRSEISSDRKTLESRQNDNDNMAAVEALAEKSLLLQPLPSIWPALTGKIPLIEDPTILHKTDCYEFNTKLSSWYVDAYVTGGKPLRSILAPHPDREGFIQQRLDSEQLWHSMGGGIRLGTKIKRWRFDIGLNYLQINELFTYLDPLATVPVYTEVFDNDGNLIRIDSSFMIGTRDRAVANTYRMISIPLRVGFEWYRRGSWSASLHAGVEWARLFSSEGIILDDSQRDYPLQNDPEQFFRNTSMWQLHTGLQVSYNVSRRASLFVYPLYIHSLQPISTETAPFIQRYHHYNVQIGLRYNFNGK